MVSGPAAFSKAAAGPPPGPVAFAAGDPFAGLSPGPLDPWSDGLVPGPPPGLPPQLVEQPPPPPGFETDVASAGFYDSGPPGPPLEDFPGYGPAGEPPGPPDGPPPVDLPLGMPPFLDALGPPGPPPGLPPFFPGAPVPPGFVPGFMPALPLDFPLGALPGAGSGPASLPGSLAEDAGTGPVASTPEVYGPQAEAGAAAKRRRHGGVEGLASAKHIKNGGTVTVYNGYSHVTVVPQGPQAPRQSSTAPHAEAPRQQQAPAASAAAGTEALPRQLPEGWEVKRSRTTGRIYYVNEKLGRSQFEPPAGSTLKTETRKKQKVTRRAKDSVDAQLSDKNGVMGLVRASEQRTGRWQKWQQCSKILNEPGPGEEDD